MGRVAVRFKHLHLCRFGPDLSRGIVKLHFSSDPPGWLIHVPSRSQQAVGRGSAGADSFGALDHFDFEVAPEVVRSKNDLAVCRTDDRSVGWREVNLDSQPEFG